MTTSTSLRPLHLSHWATQTTDVVATHEFWTKIIGLEYMGALRYHGGFTVSSGEVAPSFIHTFYAMADGSCIAFFELAQTPDRVDDGWPGWTRHVALAVGSYEELARWRDHFVASGIPFDGEVNHEDGMFHSYYVTDPNGVRVELTFMPNGFTPEFVAAGPEVLASWTADKASGRL